MWIVIYILTVLAVNMAFAWHPELSWLWSFGVGGVFVARDFCQRRIGHWVVAPMAIGIALSYFLASPFVALASAAAFTISECADWLVFTVTKRPLQDRVLWSCAASAPLDSAVFLGIIGALTPGLLAAQIASKCAAGALVWAILKGNQYARQS